MNKSILPLAFFTAAISIVSSTMADDAIDMTQPLIANDGVTLKDATKQTSEEAKDDPKCDKCPPLTLGRALFTALQMSTATDPDLQYKPGANIGNQAIDKGVRSYLAQRLIKEKKVKLTTDEINLIKRSLNLAPFTGEAMMAIVMKIMPNDWDQALKALGQPK